MGGAMTAVKVRSYRMTKSDERQLQITVPRELVEDWGVVEGDVIELKRDTEDRLIVVPGKRGGDRR